MWNQFYLTHNLASTNYSGQIDKDSIYESFYWYAQFFQSKRTKKKIFGVFWGKIFRNRIILIELKYDRRGKVRKWLLNHSWILSLNDFHLLDFFANKQKKKENFSWKLIE